MLTAVAKGLSNAEICAGLHMSLSTCDRTQFVVLAYEAGFAVPGTP